MTKEISISGWTMLKSTCPVCHTDHLHGRDSTNKSLVLCGNMDIGAIHTVTSGNPPMASYIHRVNWSNVRHQIAANLDKLHAECVAAASDSLIEEFAEMMNVSPDIAKSFGVGWRPHGITTVPTGSFSVPLFSANWKVAGIWFVAKDDNKRNGFLPSESARSGFFGNVSDHWLKPPTDEISGALTLLFPRGLRSALAAAQCGFNCIGRPSAKWHNEEILSLARRRWLDLVIVPDSEGGWKAGPDATQRLLGWEAAMSLAKSLVDEGELTRPPNAVRMMMLPQRFDSLHSLASEMESATEAIMQLVATAKRCDGAFLTGMRQRMDVESQRRSRHV